MDTATGGGLIMIAAVLFGRRPPPRSTTARAAVDQRRHARMCGCPTCYQRLATSLLTKVIDLRPSRAAAEVRSDGSLLFL